MDMSATEMWNAAAQAAKDVAEEVDPIRAVAALAVGYAVFKLVHLVATAPSIPQSVWVPLEPGEKRDLLPQTWSPIMEQMHCCCCC